MLLFAVYAEKGCSYTFLMTFQDVFVLRVKLWLGLYLFVLKAHCLTIHPIITMQYKLEFI